MPAMAVGRAPALEVEVAAAEEAAEEAAPLALDKDAEADMTAEDAEDAVIETEEEPIEVADEALRISIGAFLPGYLDRKGQKARGEACKSRRMVSDEGIEDGFWPTWTYLDAAEIVVEPVGTPAVEAEVLKHDLDAPGWICELSRGILRNTEDRAGGG